MRETKLLYNNLIVIIRYIYTFNKMYLKHTDGGACTGKHLSDVLLIQNCLKLGNVLPTLLSTVALHYAIITCPRKPERIGINWYTSISAQC
jgi:hypothetical protein